MKKQILLGIFGMFFLLNMFSFVNATPYTDCLSDSLSLNDSCYNTSNNDKIGCYNDCLGNSTCETNCNENYLSEISNCEMTYEDNQNSCKDQHKPSISISASNGELGEETVLSVKIDSGMLLKYLIIDWDDGTTLQNISLNSAVGQNIELEYKYTYSQLETYTINVEVFSLQGESDSDSDGVTITKPIIPDNDPEVELIAPQDGVTIKTNKVTFTFEVNDDYKIKRCIFDLYRVTGAFIKELDYTQTFNTVELGKSLDFPLTEFDDANYSWYVNCEDNSSQKDEKSRDFEIKTVTHARQKEISALIEEIDTFLEKEKSMTQEEQKAMEEIDLIEDLRYYKKRLIQIDQDLGNNLKYISDETLRKTRTRETNEELDEIKTKIPRDITLLKSDEFVKNSLTSDILGITKGYIDSKKIEVDAKKVQSLANKNKEIQGKLLTSTKIMQIEKDLESKKEIITVVKKPIDISDPQFTTILEIIPSEIKNEIEFKTTVKKLGSDIYEINSDDLEKGELIYHIKGEISLDKLRKIDTILFKEFPSNELGGFTGITGYFVFESGSTKYDYTGVIIFLVLFILYYLISKYFYLLRMHVWKKEENVTRTLEYVKESKESLKEENLEKAKEKYHKIKEIFNLLPAGFKKHIYNKEVRKIQVGIDRREISNLIDEYENAKRRGMREDAKRIYKNIKEKYKMLPEKYQEKVYEKVIKSSL